MEDAAQAFAKQYRDEVFPFVVSTATGRLLPVEEGCKDEPKAVGAEEEGAKANKEVSAQDQAQIVGIGGSYKADRCDAWPSQIESRALNSLLQQAAWWVPDGSGSSLAGLWISAWYPCFQAALVW